MSLSPLERHFPALPTSGRTGVSLVDQLARQTHLSKAAIKGAIDKGALWLGRAGQKQPRRLRRIKTELASGDELHFYYNPEVLAQHVAPAELVSAQSELSLGYSAWYKPYGMYCQGSRWGDHCTIIRSVEKQTQSNAYLVHRLDRATSGLMLVAHNKKVAARLAQLFRDRKIEKTYRAIVHGKFPESTASTTIDTDIDGKKALSHVRALQYNAEKNQTLLEVTIDTGRKHQVRRHLSGTGYPVVGDRLYGGNISGANCDNNLALCAYKLAFTCPETGVEKSYLGKPLD